MSLWRQLTHGFRALTNRSVVEQEITDEAQHYIEQVTSEFVAGGLSPEDARRAAERECGKVTVVSEQVRDYGWENGVETLLADLRSAIRQLLDNPGFAVVSILTLALGIGATTAIFSAVNPILFKTLPYPQADRIMVIWEVRRDGSRGNGTFGAYRELLERNRSFDAIAVVKPWQPTMTGANEPERFDAERVSASYFHTLGVPPSLGRDFQASDDQLNGPNVVILSDALWRRRFGGDPAIVGRRITLDDDSYSVIGVLPRSFENVVDPSAELWAPLQYDVSPGRAWGHNLRTVGRLHPQISIAQATQELDQIGPDLVKKYPNDLFNERFIVDSLQEDVTRDVKPALLTVLGAVVLVLLIACVNVTNLLLARGAQRRGEFAVRAALGAGQSRVIRQMLTESLLLAAIGGVLGMVVAEAGLRALVANGLPSLPRDIMIGIDRSVFAFGLGVTTIVGLAFGILPALHAASGDLYSGLQRNSRRTAGGHFATRSALVVSEVALAFVLLASSGLLLQSLQRLFAVSPGFTASHLLTLEVGTVGHRFDDAGVVHRFFDQVLDTVRLVPGVTSAAFTSQLPMSGNFDSYGVHFESSPTQRAAEDHSAFRYAVSPAYFDTMKIPLRRGRLIEERDRAGTPLVAVISASFAKRMLPGLDPIGQRLRIGPTDGPLYTIVGVVGDVRQRSLAVEQPDAVYVTPAQWRFADRTLSLVIHAEGDAGSLAPAIRRAIWSVDKDQPIMRVATMDELLALSEADRRFAVTLLAAFALVALLLAAAGIYGILSGAVAERTREIGVRCALGASRGRIVALVVRQGMALTVVGAVIGLLGAGIASHAIVTLLFGISRLDPLTYLSVAVLLVGTAAAACFAPAWRAARIDPAITLKAE